MLKKLIEKFIIFNDSSSLAQIYFQDEATPIMIGIRDLHDTIIFYIIIILIIVSYFLIINILQKNNNIKSLDLNHNSIIEFI
ncbi:MAG: cytochrome c oxidase subunit II transmembrane domain-containing protein [Streptosporangiaceae bacterium]